MYIHMYIHIYIYIRWFWVTSIRTWYTYALYGVCVCTYPLLLVPSLCRKIASKSQAPSRESRLNQAHFGRNLISKVVNPKSPCVLLQILLLPDMQSLILQMADQAMSMASMAWNLKDTWDIDIAGLAGLAGWDSSLSTTGNDCYIAIVEMAQSK